MEGASNGLWPTLLALAACPARRGPRSHSPGDSEPPLCTRLGLRGTAPLRCVHGPSHAGEQAGCSGRHLPEAGSGTGGGIQSDPFLEMRAVRHGVCLWLHRVAGVCWPCMLSTCWLMDASRHPWAGRCSRLRDAHSRPARLGSTWGPNPGPELFEVVAHWLAFTCPKRQMTGPHGAPVL